MKSTAIILCADDFGLSAGVNRAIVDLVDQGKLSAVSCMGLGPAWPEGAKALKPHQEKIDVGLHLTFTYLPPLTEGWGKTFGALPPLIIKSWLRLLNKEKVEKEIRAQFERFIQHWGAPPDFIDGHQHVHILPVIRDALLKVRAELASASWMRNVFDITAVKEDFKSAVLGVLGLRFAEILNERGIAHNKLFRGAYDYSRPADFAALMAHWVAAGDQTLIYCHPGFPDAGLAQYDSVLEPRRKEYDFFNGAQFRAWLQEEEITLQRCPPAGYTKLFLLTNQIKRFLFVGGINTGFSYALYAAGVLFLHLAYYSAVAMSWCIGVMFSYLTFRTFVFTDGDRSWNTFRKFLPTYAILLVFNEAADYVLVDLMNWNKLLAQAVVVPMVALLSFLFNRLLVFKK